MLKLQGSTQASEYAKEHQDFYAIQLPHCVDYDPKMLIIYVGGEEVYHFNCEWMDEKKIEWLGGVLLRASQDFIKRKIRNVENKIFGDIRKALRLE
jgi:hypothetical protein